MILILRAPFTGYVKKDGQVELIYEKELQVYTTLEIQTSYPLNMMIQKLVD